MHPVLTFGLLTRFRRMGGARASGLSDLIDNVDLSCGLGVLAKGRMGTFAPGGVAVEVV